jgi:hypothetical protein
MMYLAVSLAFTNPAHTSESIGINLALESIKNYSWFTEGQKADCVTFGDIATDFSAVFGGEM